MSGKKRHKGHDHDDQEAPKDETVAGKGFSTNADESGPTSPPPPPPKKGF